MSEENSIIVSVLSENLTMTSCVTKDFESKFSLRAVDLLEAAEDNGVDLDPNNQFMQASFFFFLQSAFEFYLEHHPQDDIDPPIIS